MSTGLAVALVTPVVRRARDDASDASRRPAGPGAPLGVVHAACSAAAAADAAAPMLCRFTSPPAAASAAAATASAAAAAVAPACEMACLESTRPEIWAAAVLSTSASKSPLKASSMCSPNSWPEAHYRHVDGERVSPSWTCLHGMLDCDW